MCVYDIIYIYIYIFIILNSHTAYRERLVKLNLKSGLFWGINKK